MMSKVQKLMLLAVCWVAFVTSAAWAGGVSLDLLGAETYNMATSSSTAPDRKLNDLGGGAALNFRMGSKSAFTVGVLFLNRTDTFSGVNYFTNMWEPYGGFKLYLNRVLYLELGGYYNSYTSSNAQSTGSDYGAYGGLGLRIPLGSSLAFLVEGRFNYALDKVTTSVTTLTPSQGVGLVGLSFGSNMTK